MKVLHFAHSYLADDVKNKIQSIIIFVFLQSVLVSVTEWAISLSLSSCERFKGNLSLVAGLGQNCLSYHLLFQT